MAYCADAILGWGVFASSVGKVLLHCSYLSFAVTGAYLCYLNKQLWNIDAQLLLIQSNIAVMTACWRL